MIFVPELLDRNCAEKNKTSIFKRQKTLFAISSQKGIFDDDNDDDDDDDDDDKLFLRYGLPAKGIYPYFQPGPLSEFFIVAKP